MLIVNVSVSPDVAAGIAQDLLAANPSDWLQQAYRLFPFETAGASADSVWRTIRAIAKSEFDPLVHMDARTVTETVDFGGLQLRNPYFETMKKANLGAVLTLMDTRDTGKADTRLEFQQIAQHLLMHMQLGDKSEWINHARQSLLFETAGVTDAEVERNLQVLADGAFDPKVHLNAETVEYYAIYGGKIYGNPYYKSCKGYDNK